MQTIVFFNGGWQGHITPTLAVVAELVRRGTRVVYYAHERFRADVAQAGAEFRSYGPALDARIDAQSVPNVVELPARGILLIPPILESLLPEVRALAPDCVVHDTLSCWGRLFGEILQVPTISTTPFFANGPWLIRYTPSVTRTVLAGMVAARRGLRLAGQTARLLQREYGVRPFRPILTSPADLTLVFTSRAFQPFAGSFDQRYRFVGPPVQAQARAAISFPLEQLRTPLVFISLGTIGGDHRAFFRTCLEAFADGVYQVVLALGPTTPVEALGPLPPHVLARPRVPQLEILPRTSVFITHGGMNSVNEALLQGVPLVVAPRMWDQFWVAHRVAEVGAGVQVDLRRVTAGELRRCVDLVRATPRYAVASARLGQTLRAAGGYQRAADEIQSFLAPFAARSSAATRILPAPLP